MKTKLLRSLILIAVLSIGTHVFAHDFEVDGIFYTVTDNTATVTFKGSSSNEYDNEYTGSVTIPETVTYDGTTYSVTTIGYMAFVFCKDLTSITIPNSVTTIGYDAFHSCTGLTNITIPNSVTTIGGEAFINCNGLTNITIPNSVTSIDGFAFAFCTGLTSITIPNSVTSIGHAAFGGCSGLTSIFVESDNPKYDSRDNCNAIIETATNTLISGCKTTVIPNSVTSIGDYAFGGCTDLKNVIIPNTVTTIGDNAFDGCYNLTSVSLPNSVTTIGDRAFRSCNYLTNLTLPISVTSIGEYAFEGCYDLISVTSLNPTPPTCKTDVFKYVNTQNITLSVPAESVELYASADTWKGFGTIVAAEPEASDLYYNIISDTEVEVIAGETKYTGDIVIPSKTTIDGKTYTVTTIGEEAFYECTGLTSVSIPNSVTSIGIHTFYNCTGLVGVYISDLEAWCKIDFDNYSANPLYYAKNLYLNNEKVTNLVIPNTITEIKDYVFSSYKGLTNVTIPNSVTSIECCAFHGCTGLTNVTIPNSVTSIGIQAFWGCSGLTSITIGRSVTTIGSEAFRECTGLMSVTIPNSVTHIGTNAFHYCPNLTDITIPSSVTSIGRSLFSGCSGLISVVVESGNPVYDSRDNCNAIIETATNTLISGCNTTIIPNSVTNIGYLAFNDCYKLKNLTIPKSVISIGSRAFEDCSDLISIVVESGNPVYDSRDNCNAIIETATNTLIQGCKTTVIPNSVTSIGEYAFYGCDGLKNVIIPNTITSIGQAAFNGCHYLTNITSLNPTPPTCEKYVFQNVETQNILLSVPAESVNLYKSADTWKDFGAVIGVGQESSMLNYNIISDTEVEVIAGEFKYSGDIIIPSETTIDGKTYTVTTIGDFAFNICTGLTSVTIPSSVTSIGRSLFSGCTGLTLIVVESGNTVYDSRDNCNAIIETATNTLISGCITTVIPNSVTSIGSQAFFNYDVLTSITIPNSVTSIGSQAFDYCDGLTSITIGNSVTSIGISAFYNCPNLTSVTSLNPTPPTCEYDVFYGVDTQNITLTVPAGSVELYASADTWKGFGSIVGLESETPVEYGFEAEDITTLHNRTIDLPVSLINAGDVSAFQFDIYLPEGISIAIDEDEEYEMTLNQDRATSSHSVSTLKQPNGAIRYACYSTKSSAFKGESGTTLFTIPLTIAENLEGEYKVIIKDIILSSSDAQGYNCQDVEINITVKPYDYGDSNGDGNINIVDVVNTMNVVLGKDSARFIEEAADINADGQINIVDVVGTMNLVLGYTRTATPTSILKQISKKSATEESVYIEDFSICATESKIIDLNMTNNQTYSAIQFDIVMPEGLTIDYDENEEEYLFESTDRFTKSHSINSNQLSENTIRVGIYSTKSKDFTANEGALIRIPFTASEDMAAGEYKVEIKGIVLSTSDSQGVYLPDTQATLIVYPATMTDVEETLYDVDVEYYNLQGVKVANKNLNQGVYIKKVGNNVSKIIVK